MNNGENEERPCAFINVFEFFSDQKYPSLLELQLVGIRSKPCQYKP